MIFINLKLQLSHLVLLLLYVISYTSSLKADALKEHHFDLYVDQHNKMTNKYRELVDQEHNTIIKDLLISAHDLATRKITYGLGAYSPKKQKIDCSHLIKEIYSSANLEYEYATSKAFVAKDSYIQNNFVYILPTPGTKNTFKPNAGDILAYYNSKKSSGHVIMVIDPKECIAVNATPWSWIINTSGKSIRDHRKKGVFFQKVLGGICKDGLWTSWDTPTNKFQVMLRHKDVIINELSRVSSIIAN